MFHQGRLILRIRPLHVLPFLLLTIFLSADHARAENSPSQRETNEALVVVGRFLRSEAGATWLAGVTKNRSSPLTTDELMDAILTAVKPNGKVYKAAQVLKAAVMSTSIDLGQALGTKPNLKASSGEENDDWTNMVSEVENQDDIICLYRKDADAQMKKAEDWQKFLKNVAPGYALHLITNKGHKYVICLKKISVPTTEIETSSTVVSTASTQAETAQEVETEQPTTTTAAQEMSLADFLKQQTNVTTIEDKEEVKDEEEDCSKETDSNETGIYADEIEKSSETFSDDASDVGMSQQSRSIVQPVSGPETECNRPIIVIMSNSDPRFAGPYAPVSQVSGQNPYLMGPQSAYQIQNQVPNAYAGQLVGPVPQSALPNTMSNLPRVPNAYPKRIPNSLQNPPRFPNVPQNQPRFISPKSNPLLASRLSSVQPQSPRWTSPQPIRVRAQAQPQYYFRQIPKSVPRAQSTTHIPYRPAARNIVYTQPPKLYPSQVPYKSGHRRPSNGLRNRQNVKQPPKSYRAYRPQPPTMLPTISYPNPLAFSMLNKKPQMNPRNYNTFRQYAPFGSMVTAQTLPPVNPPLRQIPFPFLSGFSGSQSPPQCPCRNEPVKLQIKVDSPSKTPVNVGIVNDPANQIQLLRNQPRNLWSPNRRSFMSPEDEEEMDDDEDYSEELLPKEKPKTKPKKPKSNKNVLPRMHVPDATIKTSTTSSPTKTESTSVMIGPRLLDDSPITESTTVLTSSSEDHEVRSLGDLPLAPSNSTSESTLESITEVSKTSV